ncbi:hypothetical protein [Streptomyces sp. Inha503]|uniref:hypothetical protein n=1 Tax=Streptomyces sp. Inha503 TaxID=3383314 RepID=UPI0039A382E8
MTHVARSVDDHGSHVFAGELAGGEAVAAPDVDDGPSILGGQATGDYGMDVAFPARRREPMGRVRPRMNA